MVWRRGHRCRCRRWDGGGGTGAKDDRAKSCDERFLSAEIFNDDVVDADGGVGGIQDGQILKDGVGVFTSHAEVEDRGGHEGAVRGEGGGGIG